MHEHHSVRRSPAPRVMALAILAGVAAVPAVSAAAPESQVLRPFELSRPAARQPFPGDVRSRGRVAGDPRGNVHRRSGFGNSFQFGRSVRGPFGDITLWSPGTDNSYGRAPRPRFGPMPQGSASASFGRPRNR